MSQRDCEEGRQNCLANRRGFSPLDFSKSSAGPNRHCSLSIQEHTPEEEGVVLLRSKKKKQRNWGKSFWALSEMVVGGLSPGKKKEKKRGFFFVCFWPQKLTLVLMVVLSWVWRNVKTYKRPKNEGIRQGPGFNQQPPTIRWLLGSWVGHGNGRAP